MAFQLWMADVLRSAGLTVVEVPGWRTRGGQTFTPRGLIAHETQGSWTSSDAGEINVMINGRAGLAGPIGHLYVSKTGFWHVVTAGRSNHVKDGWGGPFNGLGNSNLLGIEAQHGKDEPWTALQYNSYVRGVAAILKHQGWTVGGHKEHQPGDKSDPGFDMNQFRRDVQAAIDGGDDMTPEQDEKLTAVFEAVFFGGGSTGTEVDPDGTGPRKTSNSLVSKLDTLLSRPQVEAAPVDIAVLAEALARLLPQPPTAEEVADVLAARLKD